MTTLTEGQAAIIFLQAYAGITETPAQAKTGWDAMTPDEQERTMFTYHAIRKAYTYTPTPETLQ